MTRDTFGENEEEEEKEEEKEKEKEEEEEEVARVNYTESERVGGESRKILSFAHTHLGSVLRPRRTEERGF